MLQYLIILLDDTSTSYCHYSNHRTEHHLISLEDLRAGILFGMKENLMIQFVYPDYELPQEYKNVIETIDHSKIGPANYRPTPNPSLRGRGEVTTLDVVVFSEWTEMVGYAFDTNKSYVLRISKADLFAQRALIKSVLGKVARLNVVITDVESFTDADFETYKTYLAEWADELEQLYAAGGSPQFNLLTDRMMLDKMNNCGAGDTNITLAPDGRFYICPAFYLDAPIDGTEKSLGDVCSKGFSVGSLAEGLDIKNPQLYQLTHAPLCRICDAYQCKRCVWFNRKTTLEVNTPSHEQCVVAHLERNASRNLLTAIRKHGEFLAGNEIKEITYLDPFDVRKEW